MRPTHPSARSTRRSAARAKTKLPRPLTLTPHSPASQRLNDELARAHAETDARRDASRVAATTAAKRQAALDTTARDDCLARAGEAEAALTALRAEHGQMLARLRGLREELQAAAGWRRERSVLLKQLAELRKTKSAAVGGEAVALGRAQAAEAEARRWRVERETVLHELRRTGGDEAEASRREAEMRKREARLMAKTGELCSQPICPLDT